MLSSWKVMMVCIKGQFFGTRGILSAIEALV